MPLGTISCSILIDSCTFLICSAVLPPEVPNDLKYPLWTCTLLTYGVIMFCFTASEAVDEVKLPDDFCFALSSTSELFFLTPFCCWFC